ncbi:MAG: tRNA uridine-5-carboxymethylaminomethyl(34) synthesis GTPase MnmE [Pseudomonadota bacterium]
MDDLVLDRDTIAAIATGAGAAGIGVIRLSGVKAFEIVKTLTGKKPAPRKAALVTISDENGQALDEGLCLCFPGPHSFTGEDVAELQCHGGPVLLQLVLRACTNAGARRAEPGEFSQRAFLNGKIDLLQAEAISDLINSGSEAAARSAKRTLSGAFSQEVDALLQELIALRVFVEAAIDFPEEEIDFIADSDVLERLATIEQRLADVLAVARRGRSLVDGLRIVIAGSPNAGKSSLLNQLAEEQRAIVTNIPGTTRDLLREQIAIEGLPLHIIDTAGLREASDEVEQEGIRRAREAMGEADRILLVVDSAVDSAMHNAGDSAAESAETTVSAVIARFSSELPAETPITVVFNKADISGLPIALSEIDGTTVIYLSALTGDGLELLRQHLLDSAGLSPDSGNDYSARERHITALESCSDHVSRGRAQLEHHGAAELVAEDLRNAQDELGSITGQFTSDALLGEIFSSFCIGK